MYDCVHTWRAAENLTRSRWWSISLPRSTYRAVSDVLVWNDVRPATSIFWAQIIFFLFQLLLPLFWVRWWNGIFIERPQIHLAVIFIFLLMFLEAIENTLLEHLMQYHHSILSSASSASVGWHKSGNFQILPEPYWWKFDFSAPRYNWYRRPCDIFGRLHSDNSIPLHCYSTGCCLDLLATIYRMQLVGSGSGITIAEWCCRDPLRSSWPILLFE